MELQACIVIKICGGNFRRIDKRIYEHIRDL